MEQFSNTVSQARQNFSVSIRRNKRQTKIQELRNKNICLNSSQSNTIFQEQHYDPKQIEFLCKCFYDQDLKNVLYGLVGIRRLIIEDLQEEETDLVMRDEVINFLIKDVQKYDVNIQVEAIWILANLCAGKSENVSILVNKGVIDYAVKSLKSHNPIIQNQAVWLIGNLAGDQGNYKQILSDEGVIEQLLRIYLITQQIKTKQCCEWGFSYILRGLDQFDATPFSTVIQFIFCILRQRQENDIRQTSCLLTFLVVLQKLSKSNKQICQSLIKQKISSILLFFTKTFFDNIKIIFCCLRIIGSITQQLDDQIDYLLQDNALDYFQSLLDHENQKVRKQAAWVLSNISAGTQNQSETLFNNTSLMEKLFKKFYNDTVLVRIEIGWIFCNFTIAINYETLWQVFRKLIQGYLNLINDSEYKSIESGLLGVEYYIKIYAQVGGEELINKPDSIFEVILNKMEDLKTHNQKSFSSRATSILKETFIDNRF